MEYFVDNDICVGCGLCQEVAPGLFAVGDYHARLLRQPDSDKERQLLLDLIRDCPAGAIRVREDS